MMEESAIYGTNLPLMESVWQGDKEFSRKMRRIYGADEIAGFKVMFGEDEPVIIEPESDEPF